MYIRDSVVFVTGGARGIGLAFVHEAILRGAAKVYAADLHPASYDDPRIIPIEVDVADSASVSNAAASARDVTLLINNAGIAEAVDGPLSADMDASSRRLFEVNYYGPIRATQGFAPMLPRDGTGGVINILSDIVWSYEPILSSYAASKAAAWSYTNHVRQVLSNWNIQVLGVHMGFVDTRLTKDLDVPKMQPTDVVRIILDALENGKSEIAVDARTQALKRSLSTEAASYLAPLSPS